MIPGVFAAVVLSPLFWLFAPCRWRREVLTVASLFALGLADVRLPLFLLVFASGLVGALRTIGREDGRRRSVAAALSLVPLLALFVWNKFAEHRFIVLPSQTGVAVLGLSFLVLKAAGVVIDSARNEPRTVRFLDVAAWIAFLPTYPSGPMESFDHFQAQRPKWSLPRALAGLERILLGLVKSLILARQLGAWVDPILAAPDAGSTPMLLLGLYALALRFYFDLAGYSDIAIGLAALYGYEIAENFDRPFAARNLAQLWQHWHMTLTGWLRTYVFTPVTRSLMRRLGPRGDRAAVAVGLVTTLVLIGLWHGLTWNFLAYGLLQGVGVIWVSVASRDVARRILPAAVIRWWRISRLGYGISTATTFNFFALTSIFIVKDIRPAFHYLRRLAGV